MKALALSSVIAAGLLFAGSALADTQVYSSKTTQNISSERASGGTFDGTHLSSKGSSQLRGPTVAQSGKTNKSVACSKPMDSDTCAIHCGLAQN